MKHMIKNIICITLALSLCLSGLAFSAAAGDYDTPIIPINPGHKHSFVGRVTTEPSCTAAGVKTFTCSCGKGTYTEPVSALGHNYKEEVVAPTYKAGGYTLHTCTRCGNNYKDSFTDRISLYYIVSCLAKKESTLVFKNETNQYIISSNNGHFVINDLDEGNYRVYVKEKNCLTVLIEEYHTNAIPHFVDNEIVLPRGDVNGDSNIDIADISLLLQSDVFGTTNAEYDLNGDGIIDIADLSVSLCVDNYGKSSAEIV